MLRLFWWLVLWMSTDEGDKITDKVLMYFLSAAAFVGLVGVLWWCGGMVHVLVSDWWWRTTL